MKNLENFLNDAFHKTQLDEEARGGVEKKDVIYCNQTKKHYWDDLGLVRNFEVLKEQEVTWKQAKEKYPECFRLTMVMNSKGVFEKTWKS
jgi:hypothetical protein|tara:strand:- start:4116 stop:4385 length:270 start_codon:yes stop_codon:yes gene_type:complete